MKKKLLSVVLALSMVTTIFTGCGSAGTAQAGSVYWLNFKPEADAALQQIAKTYTEEKGVQVKVVTAASGNYESTLTAEMDKSGAPTLFVIGNAAAVNTWGSYAYDLKDTDVYKELTTDDFTLYDADGKAASIGYCYESYGIIVNKALLKTAGYDITDIKNFESLKSIADDIHARAGELGFDAFTSAGMDASSSWRFSGHLANMPLYYESVADKWTACPPEIKGTYLNLFKNIWDLYITDSLVDKSTLATGGYDAENEFGTGKAVFYQNGTWEYENLTGSDEDQYGMNPNDLQMIPIYCGASGEENAALCSGTENCWAVNAKAKDADIQATLDFMYWLVTSEAGTKVMAEQFGPIPYKNAADCDNVFFTNASDLLEQGNYNVSWVFNYTPNVNEWRAGVVAAMNKYDAGEAWEEVETAFVKGWATQYKAANE